MPNWSNDDGSCSWCEEGKSPCPAHDKKPSQRVLHERVHLEPKRKGKRPPAPEECWLYRMRTGDWVFSFDPPLKRYELKMHRMVPASEVERLRSALTVVCGLSGIGADADVLERIHEVAAKALKT